MGWTREKGWPPKRSAGKRRAAVHRQKPFRPTKPNPVWAADFVADLLCNGRRILCLTMVDIFTRETLAIEMGQSLKRGDVVRVLNQLKQERRAPRMLFCDNVLTQEGKAGEKRKSLSIPYGMCLTTTVPPSGFHEQGLSVRP
jgi:putative transposase